MTSEEQRNFLLLPDWNLGSPSPSPSQYTDYIKMQKEELSAISVLQSSLLAWWWWWWWWWWNSEREKKTFNQNQKERL